MATKILSLPEILDEVRNGWPGETGEKRAVDVNNVIQRILEEYNKLTYFPKEKILEALEKKRGVNCVNFYQDSNFPTLQNVHVFQNKEEFFSKFPSRKFICPACGKESTNPYECSQPDCDWKVYGLFSDLGKGIYILFIDKFFTNPKPENIFMPIELYQQNNPPANPKS